jgi:hypothetical protein
MLLIATNRPFEGRGHHTLFSELLRRAPLSRHLVLWRLPNHQFIMQNLLRVAAVRRRRNASDHQ